MRGVRLLPITLLLAGCTCGKYEVPSPQPHAPAGSEAPPIPNDSFAYAPLRARVAPPPARFAAALPSTLESFRGPWPNDPPPRAYVRDRLCAGDSEMTARFTAAIDAAAAVGASTRDLATVHGRMIEYCGTEAFCAEAAAKVRATETSAAARDVLWVGLARCPDELVAPLVAAPNVPPAALVRYHRQRVFARLSERLPVPAGMREATRALVRVEGDYEADHQARLAVDTLARMRGGAEILLALHAELTAQRERIALALDGPSDPRLRALFTRACGRQPATHACRRDRAPTVGEAPSTLAAIVRDIGFDAQRYLAEHADAREAVIGELQSCAAGTDYVASRCLAQLARLDWARARTVARGRSAGPEEDSELPRTLRTYDRPDGLAARLVESGLIARAPEGAALTIEGVLTSAGILTRFDTETGMFPNEHDSLLRELAALAPDALPGVLFLEIPPGSHAPGLALDDGTSLRPDNLDDGAGDEGPYTLVAYLDGQEYTTSAENLGDWYDVAAVVGMLNALALQRGVDTRWQVLETGDQTAIVVAAPAAAIERATHERLLRTADSDQARQDGLEFEQRAVEAIRGRGL